MGALIHIRRPLFSKNKSVDLDVNNNEHDGSSVNDENDFDFFKNDKQSVEQEKEVDTDWDII